MTRQLRCEARGNVHEIRREGLRTHLASAAHMAPVATCHAACSQRHLGGAAAATGARRSRPKLGSHRQMHGDAGLCS